MIDQVQPRGLYNAFYIQSAQQFRTMDFGGFGTDAETRRDFLQGPACGKQFEHLTQTGREIFQLFQFTVRSVGHEASGRQIGLEFVQSHLCCDQIGHIQCKPANPDLLVGSGNRELKNLPPPAGAIGGKAGFEQTADFATQTNSLIARFKDQSGLLGKRSQLLTSASEKDWSPTVGDQRREAGKDTNPASNL